ncbi:MAG: redox-regulated ATPase YchF [Chloroflexi bacterium]|nr:redox-regulated ATPase YchF [Chloroflexota bacterium]
MDIGILGLPRSGKTTIFNALTRGHAQLTGHAGGAAEPNVGVVKVPDPRLETLAAMFHPKKVTPAEITYLDMVGTPRGFGKGEGISGPFLNQLARADALLHVVRAFENPAVPHVAESVDPDRDIATVNLELAFSDLGILERRLERLQLGLKAAKPQEREAIHREQEFLGGIRTQLEAEVPLREQTFTDEEARSLEGYQFLTAKPLILLLNIGEDQIDQQQAIEARYRERYARPGIALVALCGRLEMDLTQMSEEEAGEFRAEMGLPESGLARMIQVCYDLLGLMSFLTAGPEEVRAWTIRKGTSAPKAAGKIHSDFERGFIRAEVVRFDDLMATGSLAEARRQGLLRSEGRTYIMQDGDVVEFLFNVSRR